MQDTPVPSFFADLSTQEHAALFTDARLRTLQAAFAAIPAPRKRRGQRYDLPVLLICLVAALLCDCNALEAVGRWTREQRTALARVCGPRRHLNTYVPFPRIAQIARLVRTVRSTEKTTTETVYRITALTPRHADPARLRALIRGHWSVESRHWLRAITFGEARSRLRSGPAPPLMAAFRHLALTLIRRTGAGAIAAVRQHLRSRPTTALRLLVPSTRSA